jgi:hypothetical protein
MMMIGGGLTAACCGQYFAAPHSWRGFAMLFGGIGIAATGAALDGLF